MTQSMDQQLVAVLLKLAEAIASGRFSFPSISVIMYLSVLRKRMKLEHEKKQTKPEFPRKTLGRFL